MNTLVLCSSVGKACFYKSLWFAHCRRQPCWKCMFLFWARAPGSATSAQHALDDPVEEVAHCGDEMCFSVLSKMKTTEAGEGIPSGRNWGSLDWITGHFKTSYPPSHSVQASAAFPRLSEKTSVVTEQLFLLTRQHASLNQSQTSGHGGIVLSQLLGG